MGERFGQYDLIGRLGGGGMADVYIARRAGVGGFARIHAIKRMLPDLSQDEELARMFLDEARHGSALRHPNIAQILDLGQVDGRYFIAMEFIDGPNLFALLARSTERSALAPEVCTWIVARACDALHYAHELRDPEDDRPLELVHQDINHTNILVSRHGEVKVIDFGIARSRSRTAKTSAGVIKGKIGYMAPEQCVERKVDRRTDIFCIGIVLYELLTGRRLFRGANDLETMRRIVHTPAPAPSAHASSVDATLDRIVLDCLERRHTDRPQGADVVARRLDAWLMDRGARAIRADLRKWVESHAADLCPSHRFREQLKSASPQSIAGHLDPLLGLFTATERDPSRPSAIAELEAMTSPTEREDSLPAMLKMERGACGPADEEGQS